MKLLLVLGILSVPVAGGLVATRIWSKKRERGNIANRLKQLVASRKTASHQTPEIVLKTRATVSSSEFISDFLHNMQAVEMLQTLLWQAGFDERLDPLIIVEASCIAVPIIVACTFDLSLAVAFCFSLVLAVLPIVFLKATANARRTKFCELLPNAIDLMVAVLRSGHSIPQAVKAVARESPKPCGQEFEDVLQRLNLGQPLSDALIVSSRRFQSDELDLMRRAVAIQSEVGGSLAELLDKTNVTLKERLRLARQLKVITAQSRLSALIVGLLPIVLAIAINFMSPGYLQMLIADEIGRMLLFAAILLELLGVFVMHKMSTMRV
jgi:tight adherence protein B